MIIDPLCRWTVKSHSFVSNVKSPSFVSNVKSRSFVANVLLKRETDKAGVVWTQFDEV